MKKISVILTAVLIAVFALFAMGSGESSSETVDQGNDTAQNTAVADKEESKDNGTSLGDYSVVIDSCRLAKDYEGKDVIIVKYVFGNVSDEESASFMVAVSDKAFQNGVQLESAVIFDDSVNYDSGNQMKEIKKGATIEVEAAYVLENTADDVEVEVSELISFDDKKITKTFKLG